MNKITFKIESEYIKLGELLKCCNVVSSGGEAKMEITLGNCSVDGLVCLQRGKKIRSNQKVTIRGEYEIEVV